jgi:hypothetical protein
MPMARRQMSLCWPKPQWPMATRAVAPPAGSELSGRGMPVDLRAIMKQWADGHFRVRIPHGNDLERLAR